MKKMLVKAVALSLVLGGVGFAAMMHWLQVRFLVCLAKLIS